MISPPSQRAGVLGHSASVHGCSHLLLDSIMPLAHDLSLAIHCTQETSFHALERRLIIRPLFMPLHTGLRALVQDGFTENGLHSCLPLLYGGMPHLESWDQACAAAQQRPHRVCVTILRCKVLPKLLTQQHRRVVKLVLRQFKQTLIVAGDMDRLRCL